MKIGFDIDGVLANFWNAYEATFMSVTGKNLFPTRGEGVVPAEPPTWDWPSVYGYTPEETQRVWNKIHSCPVFWRELPPFPDAHQLKGWLAGKPYAHDIYFITQREGKQAKLQTEQWLRQWVLPQDYTPTVLIIPNAGYKRFVVKGLELDAYIDDRPTTVLDMHTHTAVPLLALRDRLYNRAPEYAALARVASVQEFINRLDRL